MEQHHIRKENTAMIDLRSDTVTRPTPQMRQAMMMASVGDDVYSEDPTVNELEERVAAMAGKERALFVATGVLGNQLCLKALTNPGDEVIIGEESHIFNYETAAPSLLSGIQLHTVRDQRGRLDPDHVERAIREDAYYLPKTSVIAQEQTHNRQGGTITPKSHAEIINRIAQNHGISTHLDGARLWNAIAASGIPLSEYAESFDTVSLCFSKGLGTPIGSIIVGSSGTIDIAHRFRKIWGGGWRQAGILAAAFLNSLDNNIDRLAEEHRKARIFHDGIAALDQVEAGEAPDTNIVVFRIPGYDLHQIVQKAKEGGVLISSAFKGALRVVFHMDVTNEDADRAVHVLANVLSRLDVQKEEESLRM